MAIVIEVILTRCSQCEYCQFDPNEMEAKFWGEWVCLYHGNPIILKNAETEIPDNCPRNEDGV